MFKKTLINKPKEKLTVIIIGSNPCDGLRSKPCIGTLSIHSQYPMIDCQTLAILSIFPTADIVYVTGHDSNRLIRFRPKEVRVIENQRYKETGEMEDVRMGLNCSTSDSVLIISNNILFNSDTLGQLKFNTSCLLLGEKNIKKDKIGISYANSFAENIAFGIGHSFYNFLYLRQPELSILRRSANSKKRTTSYLFEGISDIIRANGKIRVVHNNKYINHITSLGAIS